jgi:2',3'-cyclic-nucleotide 2'-phosphodiesterase (5'-nucleotidase family)
MVQIIRFGLLVLLLLVQGCTRNFTASQTTNQQYILTQEQPADNTINSLVKPYRDSLNAKVNKILVTSEADLFSGGGRNAKPEQIAMGNFMVDACLTIAKQKAKVLGKPEPDISIFTWGSIRGSLPKGEITLRHIYQLMPFENEMVVLTLNGSQIQTLLNHLARNNNPVAGATVKKGEPNEILVNGNSLDESKLYRVLASDYLAFGGDNIDVLKDAQEKYFCEYKVRDALVLYLEDLKANGKTLVPNYEQRITN